MSITLTLDSFITGTKQSNLIDDATLDEFVAAAAAAGRPFSTAAGLAEALIERDLITRWQADKLLQGKYRGFLLGRYQLKELLGKGEMSSVYLAEHVRMKRRCAIKVLPAHKVRETSYLGRFHREAEAVAQLDHPNIVRAYDVDLEEEGGTEIHFLVMEYVVGRSVEKQVSEDGPLSVVKAADVIRQAASGVAHAHAAGLVHRDIKPGNLLIDEHGVVKVLDLGLARFFKDQDRESLTIKHDEKVLGTADYLAPEQAVDSHAVDERADIYALGCTLFFALTGRPPFVEGTLVQRLLAHQTQAPPAVTALRDDCPEALVTIINRMMAKEPSDRYQTATAVSEALAEFLVEHGGRQWREQNVEVVAGVRGVDSLLDDSSDEIPATSTGSSKRKKKRNKKSRNNAAGNSTSRDESPAKASDESTTKSTEPATPVEPPAAPEPVAEPPVAVPEVPVTAAAPVAVEDAVVPSTTVEPPKSRWATVWNELDKQLLAIGALLAVSAVFIGSVAWQARAVDEDTPSIRETAPVNTDIPDDGVVSPPTLAPTDATTNPPVDLGPTNEDAIGVQPPVSE